MCVLIRIQMKWNDQQMNICLYKKYILLIICVCYSFNYNIIQYFNFYICLKLNRYSCGETNCMLYTMDIQRKEN